jgi:hypothetical protein
MAGHGNFTTVTLGPDADGTVRLKVNGETLIDPKGVTAIFVAVAHANAKQTLVAATDPASLPVTAVPADGAGGWTATFDQGEPPYKPDDTVLAIGVMDGSDGDLPFCWHQVLTIPRQ